MSFKAAYSDLKNSRQTSRPRGYLRDPTPEQWKKQMDEYYIQQQRRKNG